MEINKKIYQIFDIIADFVAYLGFAQFISFLITVLFANKNELMLFCDLILFAVFLYILNKRIIFERKDRLQYDRIKIENSDQNQRYDHKHIGWYVSFEQHDLVCIDLDLNKPANNRYHTNDHPRYGRRKDFVKLCLHRFIFQPRQLEASCLNRNRDEKDINRKSYKAQHDRRNSSCTIEHSSSLFPFFP